MTKKQAQPAPELPQIGITSPQSATVLLETIEGGVFIPLSSDKTGGFTDKITGFGRKKASQFLFHPDNPHIHPEAQRKVITALLGDIGWIGVAVENKRSGYLIDGHERVWQALQKDDDYVPYIQVDLSEEDEARALATYDPVGDMARYDGQALDRLMAKFIVEDDASLVMFKRLIKRADYDPQLNVDGLPEGSSGAGGDEDGTPVASPIKMEHLFLMAGEMYDLFKAEVSALQTHYEKDNLTDTIVEVVHHAYAELRHEQEG